MDTDGRRFLRPLISTYFTLIFIELVVAKSIKGTKIYMFRGSKIAAKRLKKHKGNHFAPNHLAKK
jgi:hypothetical protein